MQTSTNVSATPTEGGVLNPEGRYSHLNLTQQLYIHWNGLRVRYWRDERYDESIRYAEYMLREPDMPLLFRAKAYMTLAVYDIDSPSAILYATEAVSILDLMRREDMAVTDKAYKNACDLLAEVQKRDATLAAEEHASASDAGDIREASDADDAREASDSEPVRPAQTTLGEEFTPLREERRPKTPPPPGTDTFGATPPQSSPSQAQPKPATPEHQSSERDNDGDVDMK